MPMEQGFVVAVNSQMIYKDPIWAMKRIPAGTRYDVYLSRAIGEPWSVQVYTRNEWQASLCLQAMKTRQAVTLGTKESRWGREIVTVDLVTEAPSMPA